MISSLSFMQFEGEILQGTEHEHEQEGRTYRDSVRGSGEQ